MPAQRTSLYSAAGEDGASFREWYDWELPATYGDLSKEYKAATQGAALHDSSYTGRIKATGEETLDLLNRLSTNAVVSLEPGQGAPTVLTTDRGRILDLLTVLNLGDQVLLLTSPQTRDRVIEWIDRHTIVEDVALEDVTSSTAMLSVMGPKAQDVLGGLVGLELASFAPYQSAPVAIAGAQGHVVRRDLVTLPRFEILVRGEKAGIVWRKLIGAGATPTGLEAYEALRVNEGAPGYDREIGEAYNPLEAGLWGSISFTKGCYIGQEVIARLDTYQKLQKHLVSLSFSPEARVEAGVKLSREGREVGQVTSVARVPTTGATIGLGYVRKEAAEPETRLDLPDQGDWAQVEAVSLPLGPGQDT